MGITNYFIFIYFVKKSKNNPNCTNQEKMGKYTAAKI